jgi:G3E family GTPase
VPADAARTPALVVSGFLGSGKTTLVRRLLAHAQERGLRVALVSNELGELGIDRALLGAGETAFVELEGGCVCCELSDDLVDTLEMLRERVRPDRVVIETSGAALPFDVQLNFWRPPVSSWVGDDTTVVVVDAEQLAEERDLEGTFRDQVGSADLLVLNKLDLVAPERIPSLQDRLRAIEPEAPQVLSRFGGVDPVLLFPPPLSYVPRSGSPPAPRPHDHEHFATEIVRVERGVDEKELAERLREPGLLRAKGFVETREGTRLVQVVGRRIEIEAAEAPADPRLLGRLVLIRRAPPEPSRATSSSA